MAYQTLYRKWRPRTFDEVVGQAHITSTLKNEIVNNKTAHAYVFTGTRGTGKTSTAKILSRALNCENPIDGNPCNKCPSCTGIFDESVLDVVEMDAASNNGVENIREIIDQVRYSTASSRYKVYIIDEVHMLSTGAFNALLKTLEEPPAHVVFILATTEIHKVPATILSRCQRFDFKNISSVEIASAVANILSKENVTIDKDAVEYIAYLGNGSMRDALSITEQCLAYKSTDITYADVTEILGTLDDGFLYAAAEHIALGNIKDLLVLFNDSINSGKNPDSFAEGMLKTLRDILFYLMVPEGCDFTTKKQAMVERVSKHYNKSKLVRSIDILSNALRDIKLTSNTRVLVETTFIRMASPEYEQDLTSLLDRIASLETKLANGSFHSLVPASPQYADAPVVLGDTSPVSMGERAQVAAPAPVAKPSRPTEPIDPESIVGRWDDIKRFLEDSGKLISFVSLYGVNPRMEDDTLILPFETNDAASRFATGAGKTDLVAAIEQMFGKTVDIKCVFEEKSAENTGASNEIFDNLAKISANYPENFKID